MYLAEKKNLQPIFKLSTTCLVVPYQIWLNDTFVSINEYNTCQHKNSFTLVGKGARSLGFFGQIGVRHRILVATHEDCHVVGVIDVNEYGHITMKEASGYLGSSLPPLWRTTMTAAYGLTNAYKWTGVINDVILNDEDYFRYRPNSGTIFISAQSQNVLIRLRSAANNRKHQTAHKKQTADSEVRIAPDIRTLRPQEQPSWFHGLLPLPQPQPPVNLDELNQIRNPELLELYHLFLPTRYNIRTGEDQFQHLM